MSTSVHRSALLLLAGLSIGSVAPAAPPNRPWTEPVRIDPAHPHHFIRASGDPLFLFNKTAWHYFTAAKPEITLDRAAALGANVIRVHLEGRLYFADLKMDAWPWGGTREQPDFATFNEPYWDEVDRRLRLAAARGFGVNLTLFQTLKLPDAPDSFPKILPYLERVLSRLGRHPNIFCWEIHNEWARNPQFQHAVGRFLHERDPQRRPVISSEGTTDQPLWPDAPWMAMTVVHHCTGSLPQYDLRDWYLGIARNLRVHGKPAFNNETGREVRHQNDDPVHRRKQLWLSAAAGTYTTWHSWDGCEGIDDAAYVAPGQPFVRPFFDFWSAQQFWRVDPVFTVLQLPAGDPRENDLIPVSLASPDRDLILAYLFTRRGGVAVDRASVQLRLPNGRYRLEFFRPSDGTRLGELLEQDSPGLRRQFSVALPSFTDDLALRAIRTVTRERKLIPGTK